MQLFEKKAQRVTFSTYQFILYMFLHVSSSCTGIPCKQAIKRWHACPPCSSLCICVCLYRSIKMCVSAMSESAICSMFVTVLPLTPFFFRSAESSRFSRPALPHDPIISRQSRSAVRQSWYLLNLCPVARNCFISYYCCSWLLLWRLVKVKVKVNVDLYSASSWTHL